MNMRSVAKSSLSCHPSLLIARKLLTTLSVPKPTPAPILSQIAINASRQKSDRIAVLGSRSYRLFMKNKESSDAISKLASRIHTTKRGRLENATTAATRAYISVCAELVSSNITKNNTPRASLVRQRLSMATVPMVKTSAFSFVKVYNRTLLDNSSPSAASSTDALVTTYRISRIGTAFRSINAPQTPRNALKDVSRIRRIGTHAH